MFVYILECSDSSYYVGVTNNIEKRVSEHNDGLDIGCYTYIRRPVKLAYYNEFSDNMDAIRAEKQLKGWARAKKKALIDGDIELLMLLSKNNENKEE